jgi:hypothetical protein
MNIQFSSHNEILMDMSINDISDLVTLSNGLTEVQIIATFEDKVEVWLDGEVISYWSRV